MDDNKRKEMLESGANNIIVTMMDSMEELADQGLIEDTSPVYKEINKRYDREDLEKYFDVMCGSFVNNLVEDNFELAVLGADEKNLSALALAYPERTKNAFENQFGSGAKELRHRLSQGVYEYVYI